MLPGGAAERHPSFINSTVLEKLKPEIPTRRPLVVTLRSSNYIAEKAHPKPTTYYTEESGVGLAIERHRHGGALSVGVAGLGAGTLASYAHPGDQWRFYEINPQVIQLSAEPFTYIRSAPTVVKIIVGDARQRLADPDESGLKFDVLVIDAFSSDSIPVHLLTRECGGIYRARLKPDGLLLIHISNRTLNLEPVVRGLAHSSGFHALRINNPTDSSRGVSASSWMVLATQEEQLNDVKFHEKATHSLPVALPGPENLVIWRDGHTSILSVLDYSVFSHIR